LARRVLVTGAGGFLGGAIARRLLKQGDEVITVQRGRYPELEQAGATTIQGDLAELDVAMKACQGSEVVYHIAAKPGVWGPFDQYRRANFVATENILKACQHHQVSRLVFASSPSVVFDGQDQEGLDETAPYPSKFLTAYQETKAAAEQLVLAAHSNSLRTIALRPHLIWGPGDQHLIPRLIARAKSGRLRRVGAANKLVDTVYIDNAADAHVCADQALANTQTVGGRAYFITNDQPEPLWLFIDKVLNVAGLPKVSKSISYRSAYAAGAVFETAYWLLGVQSEPLMTRFVASQLGTAHWFNISAAKTNLGYQPQVSTAEGLRRLQAPLRG
jgi:2-alkyl-3-oxoalkanoate reductase